MSLRSFLANWIRGRDAIVVRMPIGRSALKWKYPSETLYPGQQMELNINGQYTMKLEPVAIADHVFGIQIIECREVTEAVELSDDN